MNARTQYGVKRTLRCGIIGVAVIYASYAQTQVNLGTQGRNVDFSNAPATRPVKTGAALPATCSVGDLFFQTSAPQGQNLLGCPAVNSWTLLGGVSPTLFYQIFESNGTALTQSPALNFSSAFSAVNNSSASRTDVDLATVNSNVGTFGTSNQVPVITVNAYGLITAASTVAITGGGATAWGSITGTLSNQTDLENALNARQPAGNYVIGLTGDVTASGPGSASATLASVNSGAGRCGDATHVCQVTTDGKGRVTTQAAVTISASGTGTVTHTAGALTVGQLIIGNGSGDITTGDLAGDISTQGTATTTLATVNSGAGQCGDATHVCQVTTDGKGRVTTQAPVAITGGGGATAWGSITGTLSNQADLENALNATQPAGNYLTALTGDGTAAGPGSAALTLATVNTGAGQCGDSTHVCQVTTDGKGRVTTQAAVAITGGGGGGGTAWGSITGTLSNQTDLENALKALQPAGNYVTGLTGDVTASGPGSASATLATVNAGAGQCGDATHVCRVTTDGKGRVTTQAAVAISASGTGTVTHTAGALTTGQLIVGNGSGDITTGDLAGDISTQGTARTTLATVNSGAGQCGDATHVCQVTTDGKGRVTTQAAVAIAGGAGANAWGSITGTLSNQTDLETALNALQPAGNYVTGLTGDVTASGPGSASATLASVNSGAGQCGDATHVCQVTTDGKGRVTTQAAVPITASAATAWGSITGTLSNQTDLENILNAKQASGNYLTGLTGDATASGPGSAAITLATVNSAAGHCGDATHVCQVTTDGKGRVTTQAAVAITASAATAWGSITGTLSNQTDLQNALNATQPAGNYVTALTGDVTASGPGSASATLASVNSGAGQCGDATHVCQVTTDAKGRVTNQAAVSISPGGTGTVTHSSGALTSGQLIIGNGSGDITTGDLAGDISTQGTATTTLATVNSAAGQCGDATHICQVTTNGKGLVTSQTAVALTGGSANATSIQGTAVSATAPANLQVLQYQAGSNSYVPATLSSGSSNWAAGTLAGIPGTCTPGSGIYLYFATDQPAGQQEFQCSTPNVWTQILNIGPSGALAIVNGSLDIITTVVPRLPNTNTFSGSNSFTGPVFQIGATSSDPGCAVASDIGKIWINNTSATDTAYEVCLASSGTVAWVVK
ncbi:MAG: hypothetical protein WB992_20595 [Bryobacteraceae bacterium]